MEYNFLPGTQIKVSKICLGTMTWGRQNTEQEGHDQMNYAFEQGVNFFDTAELYPIPPRKEEQGDTERFIGTWFRKSRLRDKIILASKIAGPAAFTEHIRIDKSYNKRTIDIAIEKNLKRLQTDYIDLYQLHWPERKTNFFGKRGYNYKRGDLWEENFEEVIVTGSRITNPNIESTSQVQVITAADIENRGAVRIEEVLNDLPQLAPGQIAQTANGSNGTATANLRNLGCSRTLVLINGKRMAPGTATGASCADLSQVPALLLKRVEVLTGGASSVYGSDAIAGVVNFILDDSFEGFKASATNSFYTHENDNGKLRALHDSYGYKKAPSSVTEGDSLKLSIAFGGSINDGQGHITGFIEHVNTNPILQGAYDGGACALSGGDAKCGGSSTIPAGRMYDFGYKKAGFTPIDTAVSDYGFDYKLVGDEYVDRAGTLYNYNPTNHYQRPQDKINAGFFSKYSITDNDEVYADVRFTKNQSPSQIGYSGTFGDLRSVPCYTANFSAQIYNAVCGNWTGMGGSHAANFATGADALAYISALNGQVADESILAYSAPIRSLKRNVEGGPRTFATKYENITASLGMRGDINDDWRYDVSYQTSQVDFSEEIQNDLSITKLLRATNVINVAGVPTCVSVLDGSDSDCIPYNLFSGGLPGDGGVQAIHDANPQIQTYMAIPNFILGDSSETIFQAYVEGTTNISIPGAPGAISAVFGYESRELESDYRPDASSQAADRTGAGGPIVALAGGYDVNEYFIEMGVPVTEALNLEVGMRFAEYSTDQDTDSFKLGAYYHCLLYTSDAADE